MKNKIVLLITIILVILLAPNCSKDDLVLDKDYLTVSDLKCYCECNKDFISAKKINEAEAKCQNKEIKVRGNIIFPSSNNNIYCGIVSPVDSLDSLSCFILKDIRNNGMYVEVGYNYNNKVLKNKILNSNETDMCYIKGITRIAEFPCMWSTSYDIYIVLRNEDDIYFDSNINY
jgi:hypothetical protein